MPYRYFADDLGSDVVVLKVGRDRQEFIVHKKLLASQGKVVNLIVSKKTVTEAGQDVITFERDDPGVFRLLVGWLYRGHIPRAEPYIDKPDYAGSINRSTPSPSLPDLNSTVDEDVAMASDDRGTDQDTSRDEKITPLVCTQKEFEDVSPSGLPLRDKKTTTTCKSDPLPREARVCSESEQPKKRPRLSQDDCDQETFTATGVNGKGEASSVAANNEMSKNGDAMNSGDESSHHPRSPSRMAEASRSPQHKLAVDTTPILFASDLTPPHSTSPAKCSTQNKHETTKETLAELPMDLTTWERAAEPETPDLVSGSSTAPSIPSTPQFDYPRTTTLLEQAIQEADQHQMALVQLIAVAERLYWDRLFNDAMDAYMDGERAIRRRRICLPHIRVAYTNCQFTSPFRRLLCDRVRFEGMTCATFSDYFEELQRFGEFLYDLLDRLDYRPENFGRQVLELKDPLEEEQCVYHRPEGWGDMACLL